MPLEATLGEVISADPGRFEGRLDHGGRITVALYGGALSSAGAIALLNGANTAAIRAGDGTWEVLQFGRAEEIAPSAWELTLLLRGQSGTLDAAIVGAAPGAPFALLDEAVVAAGLTPELAGLPLNWRIGPSGKDFAAPHFVAVTMAGGTRAQLPLSPAHLRLAGHPGGDLDLAWIRRGRLDADSWLGEDIPLGEEGERYRIAIATPAGEVRRTVDVGEPRWTYPAALQAADFPARPAEVAVGVSQVSLAAGAGTPARRYFTLL